MDQIQKDSTSVKNERDEAVHKMTIMESRFDELQVSYILSHAREAGSPVKPVAAAPTRHGPRTLVILLDTLK